MTADQRKSSFETLFRRFYKKMHRYAVYMLGDDELAKDAVSDTFARFWETYVFADEKDAESFLFVSLRNRCLDMLRRLNVKNEYIMRSQLLIEEFEKIDMDNSDERLQRVKSLIELLPQRTKFVLEQCYIHEKTYKEVAELLEITPSGVKQHIVKGLAFIRKNFYKKNEKDDAQSDTH